MKRLPPAIQEKERYLEFQVHSNRDKELGEIVDSVWNAALDYLGTKESGSSDFWVIGNKFSREKQKGVIKVNKDKENDLRAAITTINRIGDSKGFIEITRCSGTLKSLK